MSRKLQKARELARLILVWHQQYGRERIREKPLDVQEEYTARLEAFVELDFTKRESISQLGHEQVRGVFEYFYSEQIPHGLWQNMISLEMEMVKPKHLGDAGKLLLSMIENEDGDNDEGERTQPFRLPNDWISSAMPIKPSAFKVLLKNNETPRSFLGEHFRSLSQFEERGVGGRELMISMNEDLQENHEQGHLSVYNPAAFNFQLATGEGNLVTQILKEEIVIEQIVIGCKANYGEDSQGGQ